MGNVAVDVHGRRLAVLRDVLVVRRAALLVHSVHTGDGHVLVTLGDVTGDGGGGATL